MTLHLLIIQILLLQFIDKHEIYKNKEQFNNFIGIIVHMSNNHHRQDGFFDKIDPILTNYQDSIQENNTNLEIYELFETNKRLIYLQINSGILTIDKQIKALRVKPIQNILYLNFQKVTNIMIIHITKRSLSIQKVRKNTMKNEKIGENDSFICTLIRKDSIDEFIE